MNVYDEILRSCTCSNEYHPEYRYPFSQGDYAVATNGTVIVFIKSGKAEEGYNYSEKPDSIRFLEKEVNCNVSITREQLLSLYNRYPTTTTVDCEACDGKGTVDFTFEFDNKEYTVEDSCPICAGCGTVELPFRRRIKDKRYITRIGDLYFSLKSIEKLIHILSKIDTKEIAICSVHDMIATFIIDNDIMFVTGTIICDEENKEFVIE